MSETLKRTISGLVLAIAVIIVIANYTWAGSILVFITILVLSVLGVIEFYTLGDQGLDGKPHRGIGYIFIFLLLLSIYGLFLENEIQAGREIPGFLGFVHTTFYPGMLLTPALIVAFVIVTLIAQLIFRPLDGTIFSVSVTIFGVSYVALPFMHAPLLLQMNNGIFYLVLFLLIPIMTDVGAYFAGRWFGKHNAGLKVSPRKTYEGYVGGLIFANLMSLLFLFAWTQVMYPLSLGYIEISLLTVVGSILAVFGDLAESGLKRDAKIKDSASTIPGHGGVLDLADAILFVLPAGFYYLILKQAAGFAI